MELPDVIRVRSGVVGEGAEADYSGKTVILHSNDAMGAAGGFPRMAWLKHEFERLGAETILADAGNFSMGSVYASSGVAFTLDERIPYDAGEEYGDSVFFSPAGSHSKRARKAVRPRRALRRGDQ